MTGWLIVVAVLLAALLIGGRESSRRPPLDARTDVEGSHTYQAHTWRIYGRWMAVAALALIVVAYMLGSYLVGVGAIAAVALSYGFGRTRDDHLRAALLASGEWVPEDEGVEVPE